MKKSIKDIEIILPLIEEMRNQDQPQVDSYGSECLSDTNETKEGRFRYLVALLLSAQTKDQITATAVNRLDQYLPKDPQLSVQFNGDSMKVRKVHRLTVENVLKCKNAEALEKYIKPVGFYHKKARYLYQVAEILKKQYNSDVPNDLQQLLQLPGIGTKMATIILSACYNNIIGIAVDTHVQRISQRLQFVGKGKMDMTAEQVNAQLIENIPQKFWPKFNLVVVGFGQVWCTAKNPKCEQCKVKKWCCDVH